MIVENLNLSNVIEQISNDQHWMHQMIYGGCAYSDEAKNKAIKLKKWLRDHQEMTHQLSQYIKLREDLLTAAQSTGIRESSQIDMFKNN